MEEAGNVTYGERKVWIPPSTHKRFFLACVAGAWKEWVKERAGAPEGNTRGVTPSRAHVFSCAHFFQAPATQARICRTTNENMKILPRSNELFPNDYIYKNANKSTSVHANLAVDLFHNGGLLIHSFKWMMISLSDLLSSA